MDSSGILCPNLDYNSNAGCVYKDNRDETGDPTEYGLYNDDAEFCNFETTYVFMFNGMKSITYYGSY